MIKNCESVLGQFDWRILGGNKYAVNYLNDKVKNVKVQEWYFLIFLFLFFLFFYLSYKILIKTFIENKQKTRQRY